VDTTVSRFWIFASSALLTPWSRVMTMGMPMPYVRPSPSALCTRTRFFGAAIVVNDVVDFAALPSDPVDSIVAV
jgi:hypothetical protein